jgi:hypothetical protein
MDCPEPAETWLQDARTPAQEAEEAAAAPAVEAAIGQSRIALGRFWALG